MFDLSHDHVIFCGTPRDTSLTTGDCDSLTWKRVHVWHAAKRNSRIAQVAKAFAARDVEKLWDCGLLLGEKTLPAALQGYFWIAIVVESPEHGRVLHEALPEWCLVTAGGQHIARAGQQEGQQDLQNGNFIVTLVAAQEMLFRPKVLINAIGGTWTPEAVIANPLYDCQPMLLIDFDDDNDDAEVDATDTRWQAYRLQQWIVQQETEQ